MKSISLLSILIASVLSHTQVTQINGRSDCLRQNYNNNGNGDGGIYTQWPIMMNTSPSLPQGILSDNYTCGFMPAAGRSAPARCPVAAGSDVTIQYYHGAQPGEDASVDTYVQHYHLGPIMVSLARAPDSNSISGVKWFKIWQQSIMSYDKGNAYNTVWASAAYLNQNNGKVTVTIPSDLLPGNYFIRAELIALHFAHETGGAQPYVRCGELTITGSGTADPSAQYGTAIPSSEYATLSHPGIYYDVWNAPTTYPYPYPGKDVYTGGNAPTPVPVPTPPSPSPAPSQGANMLKSPGALYMKDKLVDPYGTYQLFIQDDGNLVLYDLKFNPIWASGSADGRGGRTYALVLQEDGNMVIYNIGSSPFIGVWSSNTYNMGTGPFTLTLQADRNLVLTDSTGKWLWNSGSTLETGVVSSPNPLNNATGSIQQNVTVVTGPPTFLTTQGSSEVNSAIFAQLNIALLAIIALIFMF